MASQLSPEELAQILILVFELLDAPVQAHYGHVDVGLLLLPPSLIPEPVKLLAELHERLADEGKGWGRGLRQ